MTKIRLAIYFLLHDSPLVVANLLSFTLFIISSFPCQVIVWGLSPNESYDLAAISSLGACIWMLTRCQIEKQLQ